jgi:hypothetical protein
MKGFKLTFPILFGLLGSITFSSFEIVLRCPILGNKDIRLFTVNKEELVMGPVTAYFILAVIVAGLAGELLTLLALYLPSTSNALAVWVFGLTSVLVILTSIVLVISMTNSATSIDSKPNVVTDSDPARSDLEGGAQSGPTTT